MKSRSAQDYNAIVENNVDLDVFLQTMGKFDQKFCNVMANKSDFTLRLEVRGNKGRLIHCRVSDDEFERPQNK